MNRIRSMIDSVAAELGCEAEHFQHHSRLTVGEGDRRQAVEIRVIEGDEFELLSVVLPASVVTKRMSRWNALSRLAWQRNADTDLVTFTFDARDRLVGMVRHPAATLDLEELLIYARSLVRECDRFEYLLSGVDRA